MYKAVFKTACKFYINVSIDGRNVVYAEGNIFKGRGKQPEVFTAVSAGFSFPAVYIVPLFKDINSKTGIKAGKHG